MAKSRFEYVRNFELPDPILPNVFMVVRVDGRAFHRFSESHGFVKPNDVRALELMDRAAQSVMDEFPDVVMAFGESDEYSFLLRRSTALYNRRRSKINSAIVSVFTSSFVFHWSSYFPADMPLRYPPSFDSRVVMYPGTDEVYAYFCWRQADTHVNNLYNTTFWALVQQGGQTTREAHATLQGTLSGDKNEILFKTYGINYNELNPMFRKGSILLREAPTVAAPLQLPATKDTGSVEDQTEASPAASKKKTKAPKPFDGTKGPVIKLHEDLISKTWWTQRSWLLA